MERSEKLDTVHRVIDLQTHITVDPEVCATCTLHECLLFCPAGCFETDEETGNVVFHYEGCHECGTCRIMCERGVTSRDYPHGGYGVYFRLG